jgi:hypothetical protein
MPAYRFLMHSYAVGPRYLQFSVHLSIRLLSQFICSIDHCGAAEQRLQPRNGATSLVVLLAQIRSPSGSAESRCTVNVVGCHHM